MFLLNFSLKRNRFQLMLARNQILNFVKNQKLHVVFGKDAEKAGAVVFFVPLYLRSQ